MEHEMSIILRDEFDHEEEVKIFVEYEITPISLGSYFSFNGDPGFPDEGGDIEIISILDEDGNEYPEDVLSEEQIDTLYQIGIEE